MSIESHLAQEAKSKKPRRFHEVADKLLSTQESEDTRPWRWEEQITNDDLENGLDELRVRKKYGSLSDKSQQYNWEHFVKLAAILYVFDPTINLGMDFHTKEKIEKRRKVLDWEEYDEVTALFHLIDPSIKDERHQERSSQIDRDQWNIAYNNGSSIGIDNVRYKILDPSLKIEIPESAWLIDEHSPRFKDEVDSVVIKLSGLRLMEPTHNIFIKQSVWNLVEQKLNEFRVSRNAQLFWRLAFHMRILAAHKVEITEKGIEFTDSQSEKLDVSAPPRPIRKKK